MFRRWAPVAAALSVVAIAIAVSVVFTRSPGGDPPPLRLAAGAGTGADTSMAAEVPASGKRAAAGSSFTLVGTLPTGPDSAPAHPLPRGAASSVDVRRLAGALGVTDRPIRVTAAWQAGSLRVEDAAGQPWSLYAGCGPDLPVSSAVSSDASAPVPPAAAVPPTAVLCASSGSSSGSSGSGSSGSGSSGSGTASAPDGTTTTMVDPAPPEAVLPSPGPTADVNALRHAASLVLDDLGLSGADISVEPAGAHAFVQASPRVAGLPTSGYATQLEMDADGHVVSGSGYLGRPSAGQAYPLVTAKEAFDALPEQPRPMMACPQSSQCPQPAPAQVTGAQLGLLLTALSGDEAALLPAWLFEVKDWPMPLAQPAIQPRFLTHPAADPVPPTDGAPSDAAPNAGSGSRGAFGFDAVYPTDDPMGIVVQYGDSSSCPHSNVTSVAKEGTDTVYVLLEGDSMASEQACTSDYRQVLVPLTLAAPLGDRKVVDASSGKPVAVDRSCARPMGGPPAPKSCVAG